MRAGRLRQRVTIQEPTETQDSYGEPVATWSDLATVWAAIDPLSGRETFGGEQYQARLTHRVTMRYRSDLQVSAKMRIKHGASRYLQVQTVSEPGGNHREWRLLCSEVLA